MTIDLRTGEQYAPRPVLNGIHFRFHAFMFSISRAMASLDRSRWLPLRSSPSHRAWRLYVIMLQIVAARPTKRRPGTSGCNMWR